MGISKKTIGVVGIKIDKTEINKIKNIDDFIEKIEDISENVGLDCFTDGMNLEYIFIGKKIFESTNTRYEELLLDDELSLEDLSLIYDEVFEKLAKIKNITDKKDIKIYAFAYYY